MTKEQKTLQELGSLEDEVNLPVDKGNATVMMRREDYDTKMRGIQDTAIYRRLEKHPTATAGEQAESKNERNGEG